jgi:hypothetical protein
MGKYKRTGNAVTYREDGTSLIFCRKDGCYFVTTSIKDGTNGPNLLDENQVPPEVLEKFRDF